MATDPSAYEVTAGLRVMTGPMAREEDEPSGFVIMGITGQEAMNELFSFDVATLVSPELIHEAESAGGLERALLMEDVAFRVGPGGSLRYGMVNEVDVEGPFEFGDRIHARLRLRIVPRAWLLTQRRNSRIFQHEYVNEIVSQVLHDNGVRHRWELGKIYPRRIYCTQYEETDYDFVTRLLAEEGIMFFFELRHDFEGGSAATVEPEEGELDDLIDGLDKTNKVFKGATKEATNIAKKTGNETEAGAFDALGSVAGMVGDLLSKKEDEEAPLPRLLGRGEAGPSGDGDVFVFIDEPAAYGWSKQVDERGEVLQLNLRDQAGMVGDHYQIDRLAPGHKTRPEHVETRDYDFRRPLLELKARVGEPLTDDEHHDPPPGLPLEIYDHHGEYNIEDIGQEGAEIRREQYRRDATLAHGRGRSARVVAGHKFRMTALLDVGRELCPPDGDYAVTRVHHQYENPELSAGGVDAVVWGCARAIREALAGGRDLPETELRQIIRGMSDGDGVPRVYQNRFECVSSQLAFRPPRPPRLRRHVTETATVRGPKGQDIYQDKHGRVKVQFHWDREGEYDANTSCWLRVAQPWAGAGYGFQFFPRVGMEVLVTFIGGDTDRPVVIGALYNGTHATPEVLPEHTTRSGIRTQTSPKGGGFNELSFEDRKDAERVYIHAQRNFETRVQHDHDLTVGHRQSLSVGGDQRTGVAGDQRFSVGQNFSENVGGDASWFVQGSSSSVVLTNCTETVSEIYQQIVHGPEVRRVGETALYRVGTHYNMTAGSASLIVPTYGGGITSFVRGSAYLTVQDRVMVRTVNEEEPAMIRFECGTSLIEMHPDRIIIEADKIGIRGKDLVETTTDYAATKAKKAKILTEEQFVALQGDAKAYINLIDGNLDLMCQGGMLIAAMNEVNIKGGTQLGLRGSRVELNQDIGDLPSAPRHRRAGDTYEAETPPNVALKFTHLATDDSDPLADVPYLAVAGEHTIEGTTNGDGQIEIHVPDDVVRVDVTLYPSDAYPEIYPEPTELQWNVIVSEHDEAASEPRGAAFRLVNLGYKLDAPQDPEEAGLAEAIAQFQFDHGLPVTGDNDEDTADKIEEVYGS